MRNKKWWRGGPAGRPLLDLLTEVPDRDRVPLPPFETDAEAVRALQKVRASEDPVAAEQFVRRLWATLRLSGVLDGGAVARGAQLDALYRALDRYDPTLGQLLHYAARALRNARRGAWRDYTKQHKAGGMKHVPATARPTLKRQPVRDPRTKSQAGVWTGGAGTSSLRTAFDLAERNARLAALRSAVSRLDPKDQVIVWRRLNDETFQAIGRDPAVQLSKAATKRRWDAAQVRLIHETRREYAGRHRR